MKEKSQSFPLPTGYRKTASHSANRCPTRRHPRSSLLSKKCRGWDF
jgi:hypothetical protein